MCTLGASVAPACTHASQSHMWCLTTCNQRDICIGTSQHTLDDCLGAGPSLLAVGVTDCLPQVHTHAASLRVCTSPRLRHLARSGDLLPPALICRPTRHLAGAPAPCRCRGRSTQLCTTAEPHFARPRALLGCAQTGGRASSLARQHCTTPILQGQGGIQASPTCWGHPSRTEYPQDGRVRWLLVDFQCRALRALRASQTRGRRIAAAVSCSTPARPRGPACRASSIAIVLTHVRNSFAYGYHPRSKMPFGRWIKE